MEVGFVGEGVGYEAEGGFFIVVPSLRSLFFCCKVGCVLKLSWKSFCSIYRIILGFRVYEGNKNRQ